MVAKLRFGHLLLIHRRKLCNSAWCFRTDSYGSALTDGDQVVVFWQIFGAAEIVAIDRRTHAANVVPLTGVTRA
jgi:hypothetical protein